jgi:hypothetical protein
MGTMAVKPTDAVIMAVKIGLRRRANIPLVTSSVRSVGSTAPGGAHGLLRGQHPGKPGQGHHQSRHGDDRVIERRDRPGHVGGGEDRCDGAEQQRGGHEHPRPPFGGAGLGVRPVPGIAGGAVVQPGA